MYFPSTRAAAATPALTRHAPRASFFADPPPIGDDELALAAAIEAEEEEAAHAGHGAHGGGGGGAPQEDAALGTEEEEALRVQMEADLTALGFTPDEVSAYLSTLSLDAQG
jgi:hypothetical protein